MAAAAYTGYVATGSAPWAYLLPIFGGGKLSQRFTALRVPSRAGGATPLAARSMVTARSVQSSESTDVISREPLKVPVVTLFTKSGCTLCDKALAVLQNSAAEYELEVVDIEAPGNEDWNGRYWCDIPVFHIDGAFWAKHRLQADEVEEALMEASASKFSARDGEPDSREFGPPPSNLDGEDDCECTNCMAGEECCGEVPDDSYDTSSVAARCRGSAATARHGSG
eukprot:CAMPEP_0178387656 /NCGR_PEP_ID=MMETSP0689_2-20121128/9185_1 /TAXON_ID=160604 /ORGANISM="Amphidinium massartii, Strain CS-259" /LENGTH=224 /DNA_ID=CAMNT_0020008025 /DNA_START=54 /DNA_END=724 /DNA_ORIENTATION=-